MLLCPNAGTKSHQPCDAGCHQPHPHLAEPGHRCPLLYCLPGALGNLQAGGRERCGRLQGAALIKLTQGHWGTCQIHRKTPANKTQVCCKATHPKFPRALPSTLILRLRVRGISFKKFPNSLLVFQKKLCLQEITKEGGDIH